MESNDVVSSFVGQVHEPSLVAARAHQRAPVAWIFQLLRLSLGSYRFSHSRLRPRLLHTGILLRWLVFFSAGCRRTVLTLIRAISLDLQLGAVPQLDLRGRLAEYTRRA